MPGEDDDLLKWPFAGQFHLRLKNQSQKQQPGTAADLIEKMPSQPKMTAFDCPSPEGLRNPIGFGLQELISIDELMNEGFWDSSRDQIIVIARILVAPTHDEAVGGGGGGGGGGVYDAAGINGGGGDV